MALPKFWQVFIGAAERRCSSLSIALTKNEISSRDLGFDIRQASVVRENAETRFEVPELYQVGTPGILVAKGQRLCAGDVVREDVLIFWQQFSKVMPLGSQSNDGRQLDAQSWMLARATPSTARGTFDDSFSLLAAKQMS